MSKLVFDQDGQRFYENGVDHGILFVFDTTNKTYEKGVEWNGLISVSESPEGAENEDVYADNIKYLTLTSAENFAATITAYTYPDEFDACDGKITKNGIVIGQQARIPFAFAYRTNVGNDQGLEGHKLHIVYNAKVSPSEREYSTVNDSPEAMEMSWEVSTTPVVVEGKVGGVTVKPTSHITINEFNKDGTENSVYKTIEALLLGSDQVQYAQADPQPTSETFASGTYYTKDGDVYTRADAYDSSATYYVAVNVESTLPTAQYIINLIKDSE